MFQTWLRVIIGIFAIIGLVTVFVWGSKIIPGKPGHLSNLNFVNSPDGKFKAAIGQWAESYGAVSSFCYDRIFVVPEATPLERVTDDENLVFDGKCDRFSVAAGPNLTSPAITWRAPEVLVVRFSIRATVVTPRTFQLRRLDASGKIAIEYEVGW